MNQIDIIKSDYHENLIDIRIILLATVVGLLNSFCYGSFTIMAVLCIIEVIILFWCLYRRDDVHYLCFYLIFLCFSMESATFVGTDIFYGFKNFRLFGLNLSMWMLFPVLIRTLLNYCIVKKNAGAFHRSFIRKIISFTTVGAIAGFFTYLTDDNGFSSQSGSLGSLIEAYYTYIVPCLQIIVASWVVIKNKERTLLIKKYLFSTIIALSFVFLLCLFFGNYGNRGGLSSLQVSDIYFLLTCSLVLVVYQHFNQSTKRLLIIASIIILILSLTYNTSGKIIIITVLTPILMVIIMSRQGSPVRTMFLLIGSVITLLLVIEFLFPVLISNSQLFSVKIEQVRQMFSFAGENWLDNMASSPKMRITEFMNIAAEYIKKPWYAIFGKGFCGTIKDNMGLFDNLNEFTFSEWELNLGAYYSMHESFNCFFLVGGILGLYIIMSLLVKLYFYLDKSPWLVFGFMWLMLFYNYHLSISIYGVVSLTVGLQDISTSINNRDE